MPSLAEENYLKAVYKLCRKSRTGASTNAIADQLDSKASSVTDMVKKLADKKLVNYKKYQGVTLTSEGQKAALVTLRKHRLWEVFLVEKLNFKWDQVHEMAEELEHINSDELINRLDAFLDFPKYDPHGDPIPDKNGNIQHHKDTTIADLAIGETGIILGVKEHNSSFLQYLEKHNMVIGTEIKVSEKFDFDHSIEITINEKTMTVSNQVAVNLFINKLKQIKDEKDFI